MIRKLQKDKRENLLNAALGLFAQNGIQITSTASIAKEAGTAAGTLFLYFPSKQELINEVALKIGREQSEYIHTRLDPALPARETFYTIWEGSIHWFLENLDAYKFALEIKYARVIEEEAIRESEKSFTYYFEAIRKGFEEKAIKPYPVEVMGGFLYHNIVAVMEMITNQPDETKNEEIIRTGFEIYWNGIKT